MTLISRLDVGTFHTGSLSRAKGLSANRFASDHPANGRVISFWVPFWEVRQTAAAALGQSRKVRTSKGRVVGNADPGKPAGKCHRKEPPKWSLGSTGKGEKVR